ncbi:hypothetical protein J2Y54_002486 [Sphingomonas sp. BE123]|uniref:hypothetical protein n=1 Tax=unclassified Sphingomonas TaxID=196159 RepID=UPI00285E603B|nr:hypothetical protein [Sphingomonas sp. BE123]MDR6852966.1 hypothetical protein [Sphingomonas sp. BE123]
MDEQPSYRLEVDRARKLLILTALAMHEPEESGWVGEDLRAAIQSFGPDIGQHATLYDGSAIAGMPRATIDQMVRTLDHPAVRAIWARKVAFVVVTAMARLQVRRLQQVRPDIRMFDTRDDAIAWLTAP